MTPAPTPHVCDSGNFDRSICPDPCGAMHSYCCTCGKRQDPCAHDAPTPQPAHDHGAAGFCTDRATGEQGWVTHRWANSRAARHTADETCPGCPAPDERTETVARVLIRQAELMSDVHYVAGFGPPVVAAFAEATARTLAALDDETASLRASADAWWSEYDRELTAHEATQAEAERLTLIVNGYDRTPAEQRAADAEAEVVWLRTTEGICHHQNARYLDLLTERAAARAALDRVRALRDEWANGNDVSIHAAYELRAALDPEEPR